ncbi:3-dehydroquinate synthase [Arthrospira platensis C1]|nr:3-dehydroquinate synthase [Arthrospira platensis C1]
MSYDISVAAGNLDRLGSLVSSLKLGKKALLVSNPEIFAHYGQRAIASMENAGFQVSSVVLPAGEQYKTLSTVQSIYNSALEHRLERSSTMIALGGGVIGDMTGFAAATWLRGINVVQVPTSLLAMVDASIGGKTGVNHPQGKNLDWRFSSTPFSGDRSAGFDDSTSTRISGGKYGVIWDKQLFERLEEADNLHSIDDLTGELLTEIIVRSCQSKADVVSKDEKESGLRAILNYGHTIGHAVESLTGYLELVHGEAVAIGMVAASQIAVKMQLWGNDGDRRQELLIKKAGLPIHLPQGLKIDEIIDILQTDKKVKDGQVRFILPREIGTVTISDRVPSQTIADVLATINN